MSQLRYEMGGVPASTPTASTFRIKGGSLFKILYELRVLAARRGPHWESTFDDFMVPWVRVQYRQPLPQLPTNAELHLVSRQASQHQTTSHGTRGRLTCRHYPGVVHTCGQTAPRTAAVAHSQYNAVLDRQADLNDVLHHLLANTEAILTTVSHTTTSAPPQPRSTQTMPYVQSDTLRTAPVDIGSGMKSMLTTMVDRESGGERPASAGRADSWAPAQAGLEPFPRKERAESSDQTSKPLKTSRFFNPLLVYTLNVQHRPHHHATISERPQS